MTVISRAQFIDVMELKFRETLTDKHPMWSPESALIYGHSPANSFAVVPPVDFWSDYTDTQKYWDWCHSNLQGSVACYYSDPINKEEYWGFSGPASDATLWLIKWIK